MAKKNFIPAISVVIPMYNAEKFILSCLESLRAQTFRNFEVIVVDDCSTDRSCELVEKFIERKQGGGIDKIKLVRLKKNSGSPGVPRNIGMGISRGEYLMFVDSDDAIIKTALEKLFRLAEKFQPDVIHCAEYFLTTDGTISTDEKILKKNHMASLDLVSEPKFFSDDAADRIKNFAAGKFWTAPWNYFFRRDFLMENELRFPDLKIAEDVPFAFQATFLAKKILNAPVVYYVYRVMSGTNSMQILPPKELMEKRGKSIFRSLDCLNEFMDRFEIFRKNPDLRYGVLEFSLQVSSNFPSVLQLYEKIPAPMLDELIRAELSDVRDKEALIAFLFSRMSVFNLNALKLQAQLQNLQKV